MKSSFKINQSFYRKVEHAEDLLVQGVREQLKNISRSATGLGSFEVPSDTGAYVTSFSFTTGAGRPRGKASKGKQRGVDKRQEGYDNLAQDIDKFKSLEDLKTVQLRNGSPHALDVEYGSEVNETWKRSGYFVYAQLRNIYG